MSASSQRAVAALAASIAAFIVPVGGGLWLVFGPPVLNADGSPDNAPVRSAALLLFVSPAFVLVLTAYFAIAPAILRRVHRVTLGALAAVNLLPSVAIALLFGAQGLRAFGPVDGAIAFGLFGLFSLAFLGIGSTTWWLIAGAKEESARAHTPAV